jgi:hypothetical protein
MKLSRDPQRGIQLPWQSGRHPPDVSRAKRENHIARLEYAQEDFVEFGYFHYE